VRTQPKEKRKAGPGGGPAPPASRLDTQQLNRLFRITTRGGVEAQGVGLRGGTGQIVLDGIPSRSTVANAWLYWTMLSEKPGAASIRLNGADSQGVLIATGALPIEPPQSYFTYRADVTRLVERSGTYQIEVPVQRKASVEGASLVAVFTHPLFPESTVLLNDGSLLLLNRAGTTEFRDFSIQKDFRWATLFLIGANEQARLPATASLNGRVIATNSFNGRDGACWDTDRFDVKGSFRPGDTHAVVAVAPNPVQPGIAPGGIVWVGALLALQTGRADIPSLIGDASVDIGNTIKDPELANRLQTTLAETVNAFDCDRIEPAADSLQAAISGIHAAGSVDTAPSQLTRIHNDLSIILALMFHACKKEIKVNFKFGKGTSTKEEDRDKMVKNFLDSLDKYLVKGENNPRFKVNFKEAQRTDLDDVTDKQIDPGKFTDGPGSYEYNEDAKKIIKKHGNKKKQKKITVIVVKKLRTTATTFSSNIKTKNGDQLKDDEGILYDEASLLNPAHDWTPAHEVAHLGGAPDAPTKDTPCYPHLNGYGEPSDDAKKSGSAKGDLPDDLEQQLRDYFLQKTEELVE
jgi:hypothetical protein